MPKKQCVKRNKLPHATLLFYRNERYNLSSVVDYQALNKITKMNNAPYPSTDWMFVRVGHTKVFSKIDLKLEIHQIRMSTEDVKKDGIQ